MFDAQTCLFGGPTERAPRIAAEVMVPFVEGTDFSNLRWLRFDFGPQADADALRRLRDAVANNATLGGLEHDMTIADVAR